MQERLEWPGLANYDYQVLMNIPEIILKDHAWNKNTQVYYNVR